MDRITQRLLPLMTNAGETTCLGLGCGRRFLSADKTYLRLCSRCASRNASVGGRTCRLERMPRPREYGYLPKGKR